MMFKDGTSVLLSLCVWLLITKQVHSCENKDVELMVAVLEEVADWEGLAGQLNINTINIKHDCVAPALAQCYRREVVKAYCNRFDDDPYQVASDIADTLDRQKNRRQAKAIRNLKFTRDDETMNTEIHKGKRNDEGMSTSHHERMSTEKTMSGGNIDKYLMTGVLILFTVGVVILLPFMLRFLHPKYQHASDGGALSPSTNHGSERISPPSDTILDIDRDVGRVQKHLKPLDKHHLKQLFEKLGLFDATLRNKYSDSVQIYADDLIRAWILGRDNVLTSGGPTMKNLMKALKALGHNGIVSKM